MSPEIPDSHNLLDDETRSKLPELSSGEEKGLDTLAQVKFLMPDGDWIWYASAGSPVHEGEYFDNGEEKMDFVFFGLVVGLETELGYFSLSELESVRGPTGLPVERDLRFKPRSLNELMELHARGEVG